MEKTSDAYQILAIVFLYVAMSIPEYTLPLGGRRAAFVAAVYSIVAATSFLLGFSARGAAQQ